MVEVLLHSIVQLGLEWQQELGQQREEQDGASMAPLQPGEVPLLAMQWACLLRCGSWHSMDGSTATRRRPCPPLLAPPLSSVAGPPFKACAEDASAGAPSSDDCCGTDFLSEGRSAGFALRRMLLIRLLLSNHFRVGGGVPVASLARVGGRTPVSFAALSVMLLAGARAALPASVLVAFAAASPSSAVGCVAPPAGAATLGDSAVRICSPGGSELRAAVSAPPRPPQRLPRAVAAAAPPSAMAVAVSATAIWWTDTSCQDGFRCCLQVTCAPSGQARLGLSLLSKHVLMMRRCGHSGGSTSGRADYSSQKDGACS